MTLLVKAPGIYISGILVNHAVKLFRRAQACHQVELANASVRVDKHNLIVKIILGNRFSVDAVFHLRCPVQIHDMRRFLYHLIHFAGKYGSGR